MNRLDLTVSSGMNEFTFSDSLAKQLQGVLLQLCQRYTKYYRLSDSIFLLHLQTIATGHNELPQT